MAVRSCFVTHTLWNGRIEEIRPLIFQGLAGGLWRPFWNRAETQQDGAAEDAGRGQFLDIECELAGLGTAGTADQAHEEAGEEQSEFFHAGSSAAGAWTTRWIVARETP